MSAATFTISETCRFMKPSVIQRRAPFTDLPNPGMKTATRTSTASTPIGTDQRNQKLIGMR